MMAKDSFLKLAVSETTGFALNVVPLFLWLYEDYSNEAVMLLYLFECLITLALTTFCVALLAPSEKRVENDTLRKKKIITSYLAVAIPIAFVLTVFVAAIVLLLMKNKPPQLLEQIKTGLTIILAFQLFEFFSNLYLLRPLPLEKSQSVLEQSLGGFALLLVSILLGGFAAFVTGKEYWFVLIFVAFKTMIDIAAPIQFLRGKRHAETDFRLDDLTVETRRRKNNWKRI